MGPYQPTRCLITGGAGFIGSNFIHFLLQKRNDIKIINLDLLTYAGSLDNLRSISEDPRYTFIHGDINNRILVDSLLKKHDIDTIVHFAAESHVDQSITSPQKFIHTNITGTFTLLEAARQQGCRFHHISTDEVFGSLSFEDSPTTEDSPYRPTSPYSASKASSDHLVQAYHKTYGLPITISYCSNNYGPRQHHEKFIPTIIHACLNQQPIPIYAEGKNSRDWLYVEDHCEAILTILEKGKIGESYNIGAFNEWNNLELVHFVCSQLNLVFPTKVPYEHLITFIKDRPGHDWRYALNIQKIKDALGWLPKTSWENGIHKTLLHYLTLFSNRAAI